MDDTGTRIWLPPLAGCVRAAMLRDTRGRDFNAGQRENFFPATPLVSLLWWFRGEGEWLVRTGFSVPPPDSSVGPLVLTGPFTLPTHTCSAGPTHALRLLFLPDMLQTLTGIDVAALVNRAVPAETVLPPDWRLWAMSLHAELDDDSRLGLIEAFLRPRWDALAQQRPAARR